MKPEYLECVIPFGLSMVISDFPTKMSNVYSYLFRFYKTENSFTLMNQRRMFHVKHFGQIFKISLFDYSPVV